MKNNVADVKYPPSLELIYREYMEALKEQTDMIPESVAARWAWRVSLIPLLGFPLFIVLAFLALYRIGSKGRTGFWLLRRGVVATLSINIVLYLGVYLAGYSGYIPEVYNKLYPYLPKQGTFKIYVNIPEDRTNLEYQQWHFGTKHGKWTGWDIGERNLAPWDYYNEKTYEGEWRNGKKEGAWIIWDKHGQKILEGEWKNGKKNGKWTEWERHENWHTEYFYDNDFLKKTIYYEDDKLSLTTIYEMDESGNHIKEENYDSEGKLFRKTEYKDGKPTKTTLYKDGQPIEEKK